MNSTKKKFAVNCIHCGKHLSDIGINSYVEDICPECGARLWAKSNEKGVKVCDLAPTDNYDNKARSTSVER